MTSNETPVEAKEGAGEEEEAEEEAGTGLQTQETMKTRGTALYTIGYDDNGNNFSFTLEISFQNRSKLFSFSISIIPNNISGNKYFVLTRIQILFQHSRFQKTSK